LRRNQEGATLKFLSALMAVLFCFTALGIELRVSHLLSTTWATPPSVFFRQGLIFAWTGLRLWSPYLYLPSSWDHRYACTITPSLFLKWNLANFCLCWTRTTILFSLSSE
jgi:hypothetical protein